MENTDQRFNAKTFRQAIAKRLTTFRNHLNLEPKQMASRLNVSINAYWKNEKGITSPAPSSLYYLVNEHNLSLDWFYFGRGPMLFKDSIEIEARENHLKQLLKTQQEREQEDKTLAKITEIEKKSPKFGTSPNPWPPTLSYTTKYYSFSTNRKN